jgi:hypothetical protein
MKSWEDRARRWESNAARRRALRRAHRVGDSQEQGAGKSATAEVVTRPADKDDGLIEVRKTTAVSPFAA